MQILSIYLKNIKKSASNLKKMQFKVVFYTRILVNLKSCLSDQGQVPEKIEKIVN